MHNAEAMKEAVHKLKDSCLVELAEIIKAEQKKRSEQQKPTHEN